MAVSTQQVARELISYTVVTDKGSLVKLLERNGVQLPMNPSDREVTVAVLAASGKSQNFKNELSKLLTSKVSQAADDYTQFVGDSSDFGFTGIDDFSFTGEEKFFNAPGIKDLSKQAKKTSRVTETNPQGKSGFGIFLQNLGRSLASEDTINAGLNVGLTSINNRIQNKQNALQQETVLLTQRQDELRQQLPAGAVKKGIGTTGIILIVVGVLAIGATIYFVTKKK
jgi:hypothetical protein